MDTFLTIVHVTVCLILIGVVLLQSGREGGGEIGGGSSVRQTGQSANVFMERLTAIIATFFMVTSVLLAAKSGGSSVMSGDAKPPTEQTAPAEGGKSADDQAADEVQVKVEDQAPAPAPAGEKAPAPKGDSAGGGDSESENP